MTIIIVLTAIVVSVITTFVPAPAFVNYIVKGKLECGATISKEDWFEMKYMIERRMLPSVTSAYETLRAVLICDINNDGVVDATDLTLLEQAIANGTPMPEFKIEIAQTNNPYNAGPWNPPSSQVSVFPACLPNTDLPNDCLEE